MKATHFLRAVFSFPSVMDSRSFTSYVRKRSKMLQEIVAHDLRSKNKTGMEELHVAQNLCQPLLCLQQRDVDEIIREKYNLKDDRLMTCLVPYQYAVNIILARLPAHIKAKCVKELLTTDTMSTHQYRHYKHNWIQWKEEDVYVSTGRRLIKKIKLNKQYSRIPVFAVMGHTNHGKSHLIESLRRAGQKHSFHPSQNLRLLTTMDPEGNSVTLIDTPGDQIFVESRFFSLIACDHVLLVISVVEGIQSQTCETIKAALNIDRPIMVVFTKMDLLTDEWMARDTLLRLIEDLNNEGLMVTLVSDDGIKNGGEQNEVKGIVQSFPSSLGSSQLSHLEKKNDQLFLPMKELLHGEFQGSIQKPVLSLSRKCVGVCVSSVSSVGFSTLWRVMGTCSQTSPSRCLHANISHKDYPCAVQAVVMDASKHLFNEDEFRANIQRQRLQASVDVRDARKKRRRELSCGGGTIQNVRKMFEYGRRKASSAGNRTSTGCLVLSVIVKEGTITPGMHFVADQSEGRVDAMFDYCGNRMEAAVPGMSATLVDLHSWCGCPGTGSHVLSVCDQSTRFRVQRYRQMLQWFVEAFPHKLYLLRPRSMASSFKHVGNYGQLNTSCGLEAQLLYGRSALALDPSGSTTQSLPSGGEDRLLEGGGGGHKSDDGSTTPAPTLLAIAEYMQEKHSKESKPTYPIRLTAAGRTSEGSMVGHHRSEWIGETAQNALEHLWRGLQHQEDCKSEEEYRRRQLDSVHVGVLLKVDGFLSARMINRELQRWGTSRVTLEALGVRFGALAVEDILFFGQAVKIVICFQTPLSDCTDLDDYVETQDLWVLQTDRIEEVVLFVKWCAVSIHKQVEKKEREGSKGFPSLST